MTNYYRINQKLIAAQYAKTTIVLEGRAYRRLMRAVKAMYLEIDYNRRGRNHDRVDPKNRRIGCIAELAFEQVLRASNVNFKEPTDQYGNTRDRQNGDFGDYKINGDVYDVKGSGVHANVMAKVNQKHRTYHQPIDFLIGSHVFEEEDKERVTVYYYGIIDYENGEHFDMFPNKPQPPVVHPKHFEDFPFPILKTVKV